MVLQCYLQGWGLDGKGVDLDLGTALFAQRKDVARWNDDCISRIPVVCKGQCQAVEVEGYSRFDSNKRVASKLRRLQAPGILRLCTGPLHRMRVMCLHNQDVREGVANGSRMRLLPSNSWPRAQGVLTAGGGKYAVRPDQKLRLCDSVNDDFAVLWKC